MLISSITQQDEISETCWFRKGRSLNLIPYLVKRNILNACPFFNSHVITFSFCIHTHLFRIILQILYKAKDLDSEPRIQTVRGNHTQSCLLSGLRKYVLYEIRVLAFTRIGDGVPSSPAVIERTKDDGKCLGYQNKGLT